MAIGGAEELPFVPEESDVVRRLLSRAVIAVECENSLWRATQMPHLAAAIQSDADCLVTGNTRHFTAEVAERAGIAILRPADYMRTPTPE